jgi:hypothetical protein
MLVRLFRIFAKITDLSKVWMSHQTDRRICIFSIHSPVYSINSIKQTNKLGYINRLNTALDSINYTELCILKMGTLNIIFGATQRE